MEGKPMSKAPAYSLENLQQEYKGITIKPLNKRIEVSEEEVNAFLDGTHKLLPYAFWGFVTILTAFCASGMVNG
jgi:hypothetical protein